jgi:predicted amidohydrolase
MPADGGGSNGGGGGGGQDGRPSPPPRPPLTTPPVPTRVAAAQMTSTADADANYATVARLAAAAVAAGCSMLFLPEAFSFMGASSPAETVAAAEPLEAGPRLRRYRDLATRLGLWLSGCVPEAGAPPGPDGRPRCYNTHVVIDSAGGLVAAYRKVHLFDFAAGGLMESASTAPGGHAPVIAIGAPCGPVGLAVCFDLRFPAFFDALQYGRGRPAADPPGHAARVIAAPSAFTVPTGTAHWDVLVRARAIESQAVVVAAAQAGEHAPGGRRSYGHACICDAWGHVLARVGGGDPADADALAAEGLAIADLTSATVEDVRKRLPLAAARAKGLAALGWE